MTDNPNTSNTIRRIRRGDKTGWIAVAGRVPADFAGLVALDAARRRITRSDWVAEAVARALGRDLPKAA